jgi:hypothetical protein
MAKSSRTSKKYVIPAAPLSDLHKETLLLVKRMASDNGRAGITKKQIKVDISKVDQKRWKAHQKLARQLRQKFLEQYASEDMQKFQSLSDDLERMLNSAVTLKEK